MNKIKKIAITGIGIITPKVKSFDDMKNISYNFPSEIEKSLSEEPLPSGMSPKELRHLSRLTKLSLYASGEAVKTVNLKNRKNTGIFFGATHGSTSLLKKFHDYLFDYGADQASPLAFANGVSNAPLSAISGREKLEDGGLTLIGLENTGLELFNMAAMAIFNNEFNHCFIGAAEEFSPLVEVVYKNFGWYSGNPPGFLPCPQKPGTYQHGVPVSEGSVFFFIERNSDLSEINPICYYEPIDNINDINDGFDLIISGAAGGPQDIYELNVLERLLKKHIVPVLFSKPYFGETFSVGPLLSGAIACDILKNKTKYKFFEYHKKIKNSETVSGSTSEYNRILVLSAGRNGQISTGIFSK